MTSAANITKLSGAESSRQKFAAWSRAYDDSLNPMLSLEERFLPLILPCLRDRDLLDIGCGTGRWLARFGSESPHSLVGIDSSPEMLDRAKDKLQDSATLLWGDAASIPAEDASTDVVLASFVASYVADLGKFAEEIRRVARTGCQVYVSDLHPATAAACGWKRSFRAGNATVEMSTHGRSLERVVSCLVDAGLVVTCMLELPFGLAELEIFRRAGKLEAFYAAAGLPAIYILQLQTDEGRLGHGELPHPTESSLRLLGGRVSLSGKETINADLRIEDEHVASIASPLFYSHRTSSPPCLEIDLDGYLLLPGLINAHDHLEFGLHPNLGRGPYTNFEDWATDIQHCESVAIALHRRIPKDVRLWWGAIRNLLCGVTTVCHHNPLQPEILADDFPINVVREFGWAHSLALDGDLVAKLRATPRELPFVVHAAEGLDERYAEEIFELDRLGALNHRTVIVHGLALNTEGISLLNRRGATLVWCPTSNRFLFGQTHDQRALSTMRSVILGSDSPLTAAGDLLDEVCVAHHEIGVSADELYPMVLDRAASVFHLDDGQGTIRPGSAADLVAVRDMGMPPADTLANIATADVELVITKGRVQLASEMVAGRLPTHLLSGLQPLEVEGQLRWVRAPLGRLFREAERVLGCDLTIGKKRVRHVCTAWL